MNGRGERSEEGKGRYYARSGTRGRELVAVSENCARLGHRGADVAQPVALRHRRNSSRRRRPVVLSPIRGQIVLRIMAAEDGSKRACDSSP